MVAHNDSIDARIRELHAAGLTDPQIAERVGFSDATVRCRRLRMDLPHNGRRSWTVKEERRAVELALSGKTHEEIAAIMGRTESAIDNRLTAIGGGELDYRMTVAENRRSTAWDMIALGRTVPEIAAELGVIERTVRRYRREMPDWWNVRGSREAGELS